ncbi:MAG: 4Fe-4S binding protein [Sedimentibacter sp.]|uniref:4Fe-4S binding protein n=1 Tax=Sedimentibacter sp. TaxID=1960295 RepID=UPI003158C371
MTNFFKNLKNNKFLFIINLVYFALGFVNIHFSLLGLICMMLPLILLVKTNRKTYCQGYCPRANLYTKAGKLTSKYSMKTPAYFIKGNMKHIMLAYFGISLFFITMSTLRVASGAMNPLEQLRFMIYFRIPFKLPQMFELQGMAGWLTHLAYRFYSMMMTTSFLGLAMAFVYKPRTWCTICPISTISEIYLDGRKRVKDEAA